MIVGRRGTEHFICLSVVANVVDVGGQLFVSKSEICFAALVNIHEVEDRDLGAIASKADKGKSPLVVIATSYIMIAPTQVELIVVGVEEGGGVTIPIRLLFHVARGHVGEVEGRVAQFLLEAICLATDVANLVHRKIDHVVEDEYALAARLPLLCACLRHLKRAREGLT